jgi:tRNA-2-methylthio-N6-dimethylallyladenosine synthase
MSESRYAVRTYGCQMNEHDSERIAGLLEQDGYVETDEVSDADVIVLNTCCIRENADNKLYGQLGHLKRVKDDRRRDGGDLKIVVSGCLSQKDGDLVRKKAPWVDVVLGTFNVHRTGDLLRHAAEHGPITEVLSEAVVDDQVMFPSALPARRELPYAGWVTIQIGCDNTCAFCIVPSVRGPEISRPFDSIVVEVAELARTGAIEVTLLGQNVNSYGRDLALAQRRAGDESVAVRPMFADLLRAVGSVPGIQRVRYTSPHPKDLRPETIAAMRDVPTGISIASPWPVPRSTIWLCRPTSSSAFPAKQTRTSLTPWPSRPKLSTTARIPSSTHPAPVLRLPSWSISSFPLTWSLIASNGFESWWNAPAWRGIRLVLVGPRRS